MFSFGVSSLNWISFLSSFINCFPAMQVLVLQLLLKSCSNHPGKYWLRSSIQNQGSTPELLLSFLSGNSEDVDAWFPTEFLWRLNWMLSEQTCELGIVWYPHRQRSHLLNLGDPSFPEMLSWCFTESYSSLGRILSDDVVKLVFFYWFVLD